MLSIDEALAAVLAAARPLGPPVEVPVAAAMDRTLAVALTAGGDVPPFAGSAMDGWAVRAGEAGRRLRVAGESRAGHPSPVAVPESGAVRISTGGAMPPGAEAVIRVEDSVEHDGWVELTAVAAPGQHVRAAGEDQRAGMEVLAAGTRLGPPELAAAVTAGVGTVPCAPRPRVAVLCTGDELRAPGSALAPGEIHNSNAPALAALALRAGAEVVLEGVVVDDRAATESILADALQRADVLCVSGGVSVGPHDHVKPALATLGVRETFWQVALQPGKPTWFGTRDDRLVFGLPGNPVSAMVTFTLFAGPAVRALLGERAPTGRSGRARLATAQRRNPGREQAVRVVLATTADGVLEARDTGPQGSHLVSSLIGADALARIPAGEGDLPAGTVVDTVALL